MKKIRSFCQKDISKPLFWLLVALVVFSKLWLGYVQNAYVLVDASPLDDELMFHTAQSISAGEWLGEYNYLTLSKQMFFAIWLAMCNAVQVPFLVAGQALLCAASLATAKAFSPVLRSCKAQFLVFALLALNPAAAASFTLRVYRDNIFPSLCLLFFAGMIGAALRYRKGMRHEWLWLILAGIGMGTANLTREDGIWILPFALAGTAITVWFILREKGLDKKWLRCAAQLVPYALLIGCVCVVSAINYAYYGVFTTSDFSKGSFTAAYGAMTRIAQEEETTLVPVPQDVREQLYEAVPALAPLRELLEEDEDFQNGYINPTIGDYQAGSFYWILRRAAAEIGVYDSAVQAQQYWQEVADAINQAIEDGVLQAAYGERASTTPIIKASLIVPTLQEFVASVVYCATFQDTSCYFVTQASICTPEDGEMWADYIGNNLNYACIAGTDAPYYHPLSLLVYYAFNAIGFLYQWLFPVAFVAAIVLFVRAIFLAIKTKAAAPWLLYLILFGVLGMALLRCGMIAFMEVAAFNIGTYVMYLSTVHPLLIVFTAGTLLITMPKKSQ